MKKRTQIEHRRQRGGVERVTKASSNKYHSPAAKSQQTHSRGARTKWLKTSTHTHADTCRNLRCIKSRVLCQKCCLCQLAAEQWARATKAKILRLLSPEMLSKNMWFGHRVQRLSGRKYSYLKSQPAARWVPQTSNNVGERRSMEKQDTTGMRIATNRNRNRLGACRGGVESSTTHLEECTGDAKTWRTLTQQSDADKVGSHQP